MRDTIIESILMGFIVAPWLILTIWLVISVINAATGKGGC